MTIIVEQAQDTRAKRRIDPSFRPDGGPLLHGKPEALPITKKNKKDQSNTWESRQQRSTPLQAALAFFPRKTTCYAVLQREPLRTAFAPVCTAFKNGGFPPINAVRSGSLFYR